MLKDTTTFCGQFGLPALCSINLTVTVKPEKCSCRLMAGVRKTK